MVLHVRHNVNLSQGQSGKIWSATVVKLEVVSLHGDVPAPQRTPPGAVVVLILDRSAAAGHLTHNIHTNS